MCKKIPKLIPGIQEGCEQPPQLLKQQDAARRESFFLAWSSVPPGPQEWTWHNPGGWARHSYLDLYQKKKKKKQQTQETYGVKMNGLIFLWQQWPINSGINVTFCFYLLFTFNVYFMFYVWCVGNIIAGLLYFWELTSAPYLLRSNCY